LRKDEELGMIGPSWFMVLLFGDPVPELEVCFDRGSAICGGSGVVVACCCVTVRPLVVRAVADESLEVSDEILRTVALLCFDNLTNGQKVKRIHKEEDVWNCER
jgi:hypothetical protein